MVPDEFTEHRLRASEEAIRDLLSRGTIETADIAVIHRILEEHAEQLRVFREELQRERVARAAGDANVEGKVGRMTNALIGFALAVALAGVGFGLGALQFAGGTP